MERCKAMADRAYLIRLSKELIDKGLLIEAGFTTLRAMAGAPDAPKEQIEEMRMAFFAGAQHVFATIMSTMDPGDEPTEDDMTRLDKIHDELQRFIDEYKRKHGVAIGPVAGRA